MERKPAGATRSKTDEARARRRAMTLAADAAWERQEAARRTALTPEARAYEDAMEDLYGSGECLTKGCCNAETRHREAVAAARAARAAMWSTGQFTDDELARAELAARYLDPTDPQRRELFAPRGGGPDVPPLVDWGSGDVVAGNREDGLR